jgi:RNAse (barnase) inhibitor barstar
MNEKRNTKKIILNLKDCRDKRTLMQKLSENKYFPDYFGSNWDALYDILTDDTLFNSKNLIFATINLY